MKNLSSLLATLTLVLLVTTPAVAQELDSFWPACGAAGDKIKIRGSDFADLPSVTVGGTDAEVLRSREDAILCLVPEGLVPGAAALVVDGVTASEALTVLADGTPVVHRLSTDKGPAGLPVYVFGRRLSNGSVAFQDAGGATQAETDLEGGRRCAVFEIPEDLAVGDYTLVFTNATELDTSDCPTSFEVVEAGDPALDALDPALARPGRKIRCEGTDLAPPGPCRVTWTSSEGDTFERFGFSNGYDRVHTNVPHLAAAGATYDVSVELRNGATTNTVSYVLGERDDPELTTIKPDAGPTGTVITLFGKDLVAFGLEPTVEFDDGATSTEADVLFAVPGFHHHHGKIVAVVPDGLTDGEYDVTVTLDGATSNALTYTVGTLPLSVSRMMPTMQHSNHRIHPIRIEGTGFGNEGADVAVQVIWDDGTQTYEGEVLLRSDRLLIVAVPGDRDDPLPTGEYTVSVVLDPDGVPETAEAGTYTVL